MGIPSDASPERQAAEQPGRPRLEGLGGQGGRLVAQVGFAEEHGPDAAGLEVAADAEQVAFAGNGADDDGGGIARGGREVSASLVRGVDGLADLLAEGEVRSDQHVEPSVHLGHVIDLHRMRLAGFEPALKALEAPALAAELQTRREE